jgi:hypothetical protein
MKKGTTMTAESRRKIGLARLGKPRPGNPENWKHSEETKKKIGEAGKGKNLGNQFAKGHPGWTKGTKIDRNKYPNFGHFQKHSPESIEKMRNSTKGQIGWNKGMKGIFTHSLETRLRISSKLQGSNSHLWKGGITSVNMKIRNSLDTRLWRESVFKRDDWVCQECGVRGGELHAHHIKSFSLYPDLRFATDNGVTLCFECHKQTDNYLGKANKKLVVAT